MTDTVQVRYADMRDAAVQKVVIELVDEYAQDPMGGGTPLPSETREVLGERIADFPGHHVFVAWEGERAVGVAVCFEGFSTFAAKPLINIHDLAVTASRQGKGIGRKLLNAVEEKARELGYAKLTLEVLVGNERARGLYRSFGFDEKAFANQELIFLTKAF